MKIISIVGARPQFIKLAPLSKKLRKHHEELIIHTGQHFDHEMSDLFFNQLQIPNPDYNLGISGGDHGEQTGTMLISLENVVSREEPDLILVFGDTNTTLAGSLVAVKLGIKTIHIEAGLRSFNRSMPEEINRIVSDHVSDFLFAPTSTAMKNLKKEGLYSKSHLTGDIMVDSLLGNIERIKNGFNILEDLNLKADNYYLLTLHRPYNVDDQENLALILQKLSKLNEKIIFPVHPRTRQIINKNGMDIPKNILLIKPASYLNFINLEVNSKKIITDSGGIQKEAYILKKPCITLRSETEWVETVEAGWNLLLNPVKETKLAEKIESFEPCGSYKDLFGENVADKMVELIDGIAKHSFYHRGSREDTENTEIKLQIAKKQNTNK